MKIFIFHSPIHLSHYFCGSRKCIFQRSGGLHLKNLHGDNELSNKQTVKKMNLWRKTSVDKSAWIKPAYMIDFEKELLGKCPT